MFINADSLLPYLKQKVRLSKSDSSRHLLCSECAKRTKLNRLSDGRRKCTVCGKKFRVNKVTESKKLTQCAQVLLCFCSGLSVQRTVQLTRHNKSTVASYYRDFEELLHEHELELLPKASIAPHVQAKQVIELMPADFLTAWATKKQA